MPDLLVRNVDEQLVKALEQRAAAHGQSAEAEHRDILAAALRKTHKRSFAAVIASMPDLGLDSDFEHVSGAGESAAVVEQGTLPAKRTRR